MLKSTKKHPFFGQPLFATRIMEGSRPAIPFLSKLIQLFEEHPELITFDHGAIVIPSPKRLELVLPAYFRHGKWTSFQRQLNNFGYTKFDKGSGSHSIYTKQRGRPVQCFDDLLALRHAMRRDELPRKPVSPPFDAAPLPCPLPDEREAAALEAVTTLLNLRHLRVNRPPVD